MRFSEVSGDSAKHPLRRRQIRQRRSEEYASSLRSVSVGTDLVRDCPDVRGCGGVVSLLGHRQTEVVVGEAVGNDQVGLPRSLAGGDFSRTGNSLDDDPAAWWDGEDCG